MNRFWTNHRTKGTDVRGETIHRGGVTGAARRGVVGSPLRGRTTP